MGKEVDLTLDELGKEVLEVCHDSLVEVEVGIGGRSLSNCQDRFSLTVLLEGPGVQGTNEEVSPDTSRC